MNVLKLSLKEFKRNLLSIASLFFIVAIGLFAFKTNSYDKIVRNILPATIFMISSSIMMFLSLYRDKESGFISFVRSSGKYIEYYLAKVLASVYMILLFSLVLIIYSLIISFSNAADVFVFYIGAIKHILLYFTLTSFVTAVLGSLIFTLFSSKIGMSLSLLIPIFISHFGIAIISLIPFSKILPLNSLAFIHYLNIGQFSDRFYPDYNYLFEVESVEFYKRIGILMIILLVLFLVEYLKDRKRKNIIGLVITFLLSVTFIFLANDEVFVRRVGTFSPNARSNIERNYYLKNKSQFKEGNFKIIKMKGKLDFRKILKADLNLSIKLSEDKKEIDLSLYHGFKVKEIKVGKDKLKFSRESDFIKVELDKVYKKDSVIDLFISYEGYSSQYFYAGEQAVLLPSYFNYLPYPGAYQSFIIRGKSNESVVPLYIKNKVMYDFKIKANKEVATNLEKKNGRYVGESSSGVTIVSGNFIKKQKDGVKFYIDYAFLDTKTSDFKFKYDKELLKEFKVNAPEDVKHVFVFDFYQRGFAGFISIYSSSSALVNEMLLGRRVLLREVELYLGISKMDLKILSQNTLVLKLFNDLLVKSFEDEKDKEREKNILENIDFYLKNPNEREIYLKLLKMDKREKLIKFKTLLKLIKNRKVSEKEIYEIVR